MIIQINKEGELVDNNSKLVLVQIGNTFYSLHREFIINTASDLKAILNNRVIKLLREE